jgi:hypothetical protein
MKKPVYHVRFRDPVGFMFNGQSFAMVAIDTDSFERPIGPFSNEVGWQAECFYKCSVVRAYSVGQANAPQNLAMHPLFVPIDNIASITLAEPEVPPS